MYDKSCIIVSAIISVSFQNKTDVPRKFNDAGPYNSLIREGKRYHRIYDYERATIHPWCKPRDKNDAYVNEFTIWRRGVAGLPLWNSPNFFAVNGSRNLSKLVFGAGILANDVTVRCQRRKLEIQFSCRVDESSVLMHLENYSYASKFLFLYEISREIFLRV